MATAQASHRAGGEGPPARAGEQVKVWDPFVRVFHWSLFALFVGAYATGDEIEWLHIRLGYAIAGLIAVRIAWGFVGSRHARFSDFVRGPGAILDYLRALWQGRAPRHLGHNPAGGAMILALILALAVTCVTGLLMTTEGLWGAAWLEEVHEAAAHVTVGLVVLHVGGVLVSSLLHRENLVKAMFTGRKRSP